MKPRRIQTPLSEKDVRKLRVGQFVLINGYILTARDRIHRFLFEERPDRREIPFELEGAVIYHCGPVLRETDENYRFVVGGPTTSARMEPYEWFLIKHYGIRGIIGKGGMGENTLKAMKEEGCVYFHTLSGCAALLADRIREIQGPWKEEFGLPEAMWLLYVEDLPALITMDSEGNSLHRKIRETSDKALRRLLKR